MFTPEEISIIQARQLRKTLHHVYERSPFYRDLMDREGLLPADIKTLQDLHYFPTTSGNDLVREGDRFLSVRPEEVADVFMTSGDRGAPLVIKTTAQDMSRLAYNEQLVFLTAEVQEKDIVALVVTMDNCSMPGMAYYLGLRRIGAAVLRLGQISPDMFLRILDRTEVSVLVAAPGFLKSVITQAEKENINLRRTTVKKLVCVGEPVRQADFTLNPLGALLARTWDAGVFSTYSTTDLSSTLCECEAGCGGHLHPELMHLEIVDGRGRVVPEGEVGEICVTPFGITGMPIIRYRTGDYSFISGERCNCGRFTSRLGPVSGQPLGNK